MHFCFLSSAGCLRALECLTVISNVHLCTCKRYYSCPLHISKQQWEHIDFDLEPWKVLSLMSTDILKTHCKKWMPLHRHSIASFVRLFSQWGCDITQISKEPFCSRVEFISSGHRHLFSSWALQKMASQWSAGWSLGEPIRQTYPPPSKVSSQVLTC